MALTRQWPSSHALVSSHLREPRSYLRTTFAAALCYRTKPLTKGKRVSLHIGIEKLDREGAVHDRPALADELVEPVVGHHALAVGIDVGAVAFAGLSAVDRDAEAHRLAIGVRPEHQVQIAGMEAKRNRPVRLVERRGLAANRPLAGKTPVVELFEIAGRIVMGRVADRAAGRSEIL